LREPLDSGLRVVVIVRDDGVENTLDVGLVAFVELLEIIGGEVSPAVELFNLLQNLAFGI
jgi:hypothetical protein